MKLELKNMYILQEENKDLKKDLDKYRKMELEGEIGLYKGMRKEFYRLSF